MKKFNSRLHTEEKASFDKFMFELFKKKLIQTFFEEGETKSKIHPEVLLCTCLKMLEWSGDTKYLFVARS